MRSLNSTDSKKCSTAYVGHNIGHNVGHNITQYTNIITKQSLIHNLDCKRYGPSSVPCPSTTTATTTTTTATTTTTTTSTASTSTTTNPTTTISKTLVMISSALTSTFQASSVVSIPSEENNKTHSNTLIQHETAEDLADAFPTAAWIGVATTSLMLIVIFVTLFFKRQQVLKTFTEHNHDDHIEDNNVTKNHLGANEFSVKNTNDNTTAYENIGFGREYYQETGKGPPANAQMTSNVIYDAFEPNESANDAQSLVNENSPADKNSSKMTVNVIYDHGYHSERHANDSYATAQDHSFLDVEAEKKLSAVVDDEQHQDVYNFAKNVSAEPSATAEIVYNGLYQSYTG